ncbi:MAG: flagellar protein FlaG [Betaproteobacteria bacterium]|nr:flagellar protein FlaG [Betaproteobacteria bacterium]
MDITSIGGATPVTPLPQNPQQGRAPNAPVSRETMADNAGGSKGADSARQAPPANMPVVGKEETSLPNWPRQPGAEAQSFLANQTRRGQAASQPSAEPESVFNRPMSPEQKAEMAKQELEELQRSVDEIRQFVLPYNSSLNFSVDKDSGRLIVKVVDNETQEVIKQIPSEDAMKLARSLEQLQGLLVRQKA